MIRIVFILFILLGSVAWIGYAGFGLIQKNKNSYAPDYVFELDKDEVLIVNRPKELNSFDIFPDESVNDYVILAPNLVEDYKLYFSKNKSIVIIEHQEFWDKITVEQLINATRLDRKDLKNEKGRFLCFSKNEINLSDTSMFDYKFVDKNATANLLSASSSADIYLQPNGAFSYNSTITNQTFGAPVNDLEVFSDVVPSAILNYSFYEHFYLQSLDSVYKNSVMSKWVNTGIVTGELDKEKFIISDYKAQQNPNYILLESLKEIDTNYLKNDVKHFKGIKLTNDFPASTKKGFYLIEIGDKVVFANTEETCRKISLGQKLGNTLAVNQTKREGVFNNLSTKVNERSSYNSIKQTITFVGNLEYKVLTNEKLKAKKEVIESAYSYRNTDNISFITPIKDHLNNGVSVFVTTKNEYRLISSKGKQIWEGKTDTLIQKPPIVVDLYDNGRKQLAFTAGKKVYVLDVKGENVNGFPYTSTANFSTSPCSIKWKNQTKIVAANALGEIIYLNAKGGELNVVKSKVKEIDNPIFGYNNNGILSCWFKSKTKEYLVALERNNDVKSFTKRSNFFFKENGKILSLNIENGATSVKDRSNTLFYQLPFDNVKLNPNSMHKYANGKLDVFNQKGDNVLNTAFLFSDVSKVILADVNSETYVLILDDIENNIYLFNNSQELMGGFPKEGQAKIEMKYDSATKTIYIFTTLEKNLICYKIKT